MKKIILSIALLTVTGSISAMDLNMPMDRPNTIPKDMIPNKTVQQEAASLYKDITALKITKKVMPNGATIQLPGDFIELLQNTLTVAHTMTSEEGKEIEQLHLAYAQIQYPYWRQDLDKVMGNDPDFMNALAKYDTAFNSHQQLCDQLAQLISTRPNSIANFSGLWRDIATNNEIAAAKDIKDFMAPVSVPASQQDLAESTLKKLMESNATLKTQLTKLQTLFKTARSNKALEDHMKKIEYLVKQNVQWMIAFGIAINPDFAKAVTSEMTDHLTTTLKNLHTSPKVVALQKMQTSVAKK